MAIRPAHSLGPLVPRAGLSNESWSIMKNVATELGIILIGYFTLVPAIQVRLCPQLYVLAAIWCVCVSVHPVISCKLLIESMLLYQRSQQGQGRKPNFHLVLPLN